jgi:hypothetical protein
MFQPPWADNENGANGPLYRRRVHARFAVVLTSARQTFPWKCRGTIK